MSKQIDPALIGVGNPVLMSSDDDPFWNDLKARLGVRASIAAAYQAVAFAPPGSNAVIGRTDFQLS